MAPTKGLLLLQTLRPAQAVSLKVLYMLPAIRTFHSVSKIARSHRKGRSVSPSPRMTPVLGGAVVV